MKLALVVLLLLVVDFAVAIGQQLPSTAETDRNLDQPPTFQTPPAPVLRPQAELQTIRLADGYRLELVASDPLIQDPIAITFDPNGRLWVCEMRGFMPNIEGTGEEAPVGVISVLDDMDGDGVMDRSTVFQGGLVLPRALCWTIDGLLVCENGTIWLCKDSDGDDHCDDKQVVCTYNPGNLEHALNGLMPALDNWIYNAKEGMRLRRMKGRWLNAPIAARGQWGITQDNHGYLYYNVNASLLRGDLVPCYSSVALHDNPLVDVQLYDDQVLFPIRPTPGINRGYLPGFLRDDGSMIEANSNCGPVVYRGDNLPQDLLGNVFIPDPAGNLVRRQIVVTSVAGKSSHNAYDQREFVASTDERFRPVNMFNSPDGTLYIVDMYRGIIQHGAFITSYLREQILERKLDEGVNLGRIWRVTHETTQPRQPIALNHLPSSELVGLLSHANGWHRDMAQQLLVQRGDLSVTNRLEAVVALGDNSLGRLHALWTLEGLGQLDPEFLYETLSDSDANVRASAVTLLQRFLTVETLQPMVVEDIREIADDSDLLVRLQVVQTLGTVGSADAELAIEPILREATEADSNLIGGMLGGFAGRESEFLIARLSNPSWDEYQSWRAKLLGKLAGIMWKQRDAVSILRFCHLVANIPEQRAWQQIALLEGIMDPPAPPARPRFAPPPGTAPPSNTDLDSLSGLPPGASPGLGRRRSMTVKLHAVPEGLSQLCTSSNERLAQAANAFASKLLWPGKDGQPLPQPPPLSKEQQRLYELGRRQYLELCAACHHPAGYGLAAKGPELLASDWLLNEQRLIRVVLHGLQGPINVNGSLYNIENRLVMPGMSKQLDDEKIAGVLTFVRRDFVEDASPIAVETVAALRESFLAREAAWTEVELSLELKLPAGPGR